MSVKQTVQKSLLQLYMAIGVYAIATLFIVGLSIHNRIDMRIDTTKNNKDILYIPSGQSILSVAQKIAQMAQSDTVVVYSAIKIMNKHIKSGEYMIYPHMRSIDILNAIDTYQVKQRKITITNGVWYGHMDKIIEDTAFVQHKTMIPRNKVIWAETYFYERDTSAKNLIIQMQDLHLATAEQMWQNRDPTIPLNTLPQALVLASIVERETGIASEQPIVAGVFLNRLRKNMRLQSDPTVIYAITNGNGMLNRPIRKSDLTYDSPYNTYIHYGVPPTPIASVGLHALQSVLHPEKHTYYYFVASPQGGHVFSKTLREHNRNVTKYRNHIKP